MRCRICKSLIAEEIEGKYIIRCRRCRFVNHEVVSLGVAPKYDVRCVECGHLLAEHLDGVATLTCRSCKRRHKYISPMVLTPDPDCALSVPQIVAAPHCPAASVRKESTPASCGPPARGVRRRK